MDALTGTFLRNQLAEASALAEASDLLEVAPVAGAQFVLAEYRCRGLVRRGDAIEDADNFVVGFRFPADYLRRVHPAEILVLVSPAGVWHPNIGRGDTPAPICIGRITPGTPLVELLYRVHELLTWQTFSTLEYDTLQPEACEWARRNASRFPTDSRPLRWRAEGHPAAATLPRSDAHDLLATMEVVE